MILSGILADDQIETILHGLIEKVNRRDDFGIRI
jgi:hypothetical protein